jgi:membrane protein
MDTADRVLSTDRKITLKHGGRRCAELLREAWYEYERDYARYFAKAIAYYALFSLVPVLLLVLAVSGLLLRFSDVAATAEQRVRATIEARVGVEVQALIDEPLRQLKQQSVAASVVGFVGLLLSASVLFRHLRLSFRAIWKQAPPMVAGSVRSVARAMLREWMASTLMVAVCGLLLLVALVLMTVTQWLTGLLNYLPRVNEKIGWLLALPIPMVLAVLTFALLFTFLPPVRLPWRQVRLAAVLCGLAWTIAAEMLVFYGVVFGSSLGAYGAVGGFLMVLISLNIVSQVLFFGGELCKVVARRESLASNAVGRQ